MDPNTQLISSTEVYYPSAGEWREVPGALPRPMAGIQVVTLNNRVLLFGEITILKRVDNKSIGWIFKVAQT